MPDAAAVNQAFNWSHQPCQAESKDQAISVQQQPHYPAPVSPPPPPPPPADAVVGRRRHTLIDILNPVVGGGPQGDETDGASTIKVVPIN